MSSEHDLFLRIKPFIVELLPKVPATSPSGGGVTMAAVNAAIAAHTAIAGAHHAAWTQTDTDARYYSKTLLDGGQLDSRYYSKATADSRFALKTRNLVGGLGLSGGGDLTANRIIALASSSAPGAAAAILASSASGQLTLPLFVASTSIITPSLTSLAALAITSASGDISLDASTDVISIGASNLLKSANYASQATGWGISYAGGADFRYLFVDEMHAKSFIADLEQALAGGQIISKSVAMLYANFTAPAAAAATTLTVRDLLRTSRPR